MILSVRRWACALLLEAWNTMGYGVSEYAQNVSRERIVLLKYLSNFAMWSLHQTIHNVSIKY